ncbi:MAG: sigma factor, partial [Kofleriaceae bacterium]
MPLFARLFRSAPDRELRDAIAGDRGAIERFYDAHVAGLYAFVFYRVGRDGSLAEDVVQETFANALARTADYDPKRGSVASWLAVMSRNVIRDHLREHRRADQLLETWDRIDATLAQTFAAMAERPLMFDIDHFKAINDKHGDPEGCDLKDILCFKLGKVEDAGDEYL